MFIAKSYRNHVSDSIISNQSKTKINLNSLKIIEKFNLGASMTGRIGAVSDKNEISVISTKTTLS